MRAVSVFGVIFLIFIDFECPTLRRRVSARCVLPNVVMVRKGHFYHHFSEQGRSPCKTVSCRWGGETPKRDLEKYLMGSNWLTKKIDQNQIQIPQKILGTGPAAPENIPGLRPWDFPGRAALGNSPGLWRSKSLRRRETWARGERRPGPAALNVCWHHLHQRSAIMMTTFRRGAPGFFLDLGH